MATAYTTLLGLALPVTGELNGTWGDVVNDSITELVEDAIAGSATASVTSADWTLTTTGSGAANQARSAILIPTGTPGVSRNIIAPSSSKAYIVDNQSNAAVVVKGSATTGVSIATNTAALVAWDGADFVLVAQDLANASGTLPVTKGGSGQTSYTDGQLLIGNSSGNTLTKATLTQGSGITITNGAGSITIAAAGGGTVSSVAVSGGTTGLTTSGGPITTSGTITLAGTLAVANGGTGATSLTANNVLLGNGTSALQVVAPGTSGNVLTSNGSTWTSAAAGASLLGQTNSAAPYETSLGFEAGNSNTGNNNSFIGWQAGKANTSGAKNTVVGTVALYSNTSGGQNVAIGSDALYTNTTGNNNTAVGYSSLQSVETTGSNTAIGSFSMSALVSGSDNVAIGVSALRFNDTKDDNVAVGTGALTNATSASNVGIGKSALLSLTTGSENIGIGKSSGEASSHSLTTGSKNIFIGFETRGSSASSANQIVIGYNVVGQADTNITIGNSTGKIYNSYAVNATWTQTSDGTMKNVIGEDTLGLSFIKRLKTIKFTWKPQNDLPKDHPYYSEENKKDTTTVIHGFVAQEVKEALDAEGCATFNGWDQGSDGIQAISREMFISPLVKAIQELSSQVDALKTEIENLKGV